MDDEEMALIRGGVQETIRTLRHECHSEDDHAADLAGWLKRTEDQIVQRAVDKIMQGRAMLVD